MDTTDEAVAVLQQRLHEKDMKLTDIQLEALSSAHQLDQLRQTMNRMKVFTSNATQATKALSIRPSLACSLTIPHLKKMLSML